MKIKVGFGFDVHRLAEGEELWIGGIKIPSEKGAVGHSDADVLIHAICDALLGAVNLRDIGYHFPDTSPEFKGIESLKILEKVCELIKERADFVNDFWEQSYFFFEAPREYDKKVVKKQWKEQTPELLSQLKDELNKLDNFIASEIEELIKDFLLEKELGMGKIMNPLRLTLVGKSIGPKVFEIAELIGKSEVIKRIETGIEKII